MSQFRRETESLFGSAPLVRAVSDGRERLTEGNDVLEAPWYGSKGKGSKFLRRQLGDGLSSDARRARVEGARGVKGVKGLVQQRRRASGSGAS